MLDLTLIKEGNNIITLLEIKYKYQIRCPFLIIDLYIIYFFHIELYDFSVLLLYDTHNPLKSQQSQLCTSRTLPITGQHSLTCDSPTLGR